MRTFDAATSLLYVLSPAPLSTLSRVNLLQVCSWPKRRLLWLLWQRLDYTVLRESLPRHEQMLQSRVHELRRLSV